MSEEFIPKGLSDRTDDAEEKSARKKRLEKSQDLIRIINVKRDDIRNEQDLYEKDLRKQEDEDYPKKSKAVDQRND